MSEQRIVVAVTGGIASYRACELVRLLVKRGRTITVCMTRSATQFVTPLTFEALSGGRVYVDLFEDGMAHIELKRNASVFAVVPATANVIGKFANGIADDLVSTTYLAMNSPVLIAPAMNPGMYAHPATQRNLDRLRGDGVIIMDPDSGEVICGDEGVGRLAAVEKIADTIESLLESGKLNR